MGHHMQDGGEQTEARQVAQGWALAHFRLADQTTPHGLYPAEERLLAKVREGEICEIDAARPEAASPDNKVRAEFVRFLALGGDGGAPVHEHRVQLQGAFIEGDLDLEGCEGDRAARATRTHVMRQHPRHIGQMTTQGLQTREKCGLVH
jgi:hypothetical protein